MKKAALLGALLSSALISVPSAHAVKLKDADIDFGIQYRVMYNNSNLFQSKQYDFFRQRLRLNFDVHTEENVGGFFQIEYRGGWGGSSPEASDPRGRYAINAFNRLQARGIRYGYLYFPVGPGLVLAGILPANDQVDQMLFSADWDLNVGGVAYAGKVGDFNWRAAYVRLVEGVDLMSNSTINKDQDEHFLVLDLNTKVANIDTGVHFYGAYGKVCFGDSIASNGIADCVPVNDPYGNPSTDPLAPADNLNQTWIGAHATIDLNPVNLHGVVLYNTGKIANTSNNGFLVRIEPSINFGNVKASLLGIYSTGKNNGNGFYTVHHILGTGGYWAYTYIFTPHGPSDVNDFGLEPGNRGYGLTTIQAKVDVPITNKLSAQAVAGYFRSNKDMGGNGKSLGTEFGAQLAVNLGKHMNLEFGGAIASLGNAAKAVYNGVPNKSSVNETFARLQLEF